LSFSFSRFLFFRILSLFIGMLFLKIILSSLIHSAIYLDPLWIHWSFLKNQTLEFFVWHLIHFVIGFSYELLEESYCLIFLYFLCLYVKIYTSVGMNLPLLCEGLLRDQPSLDNISWDISLLCSVEFNSNWTS
jgi:hypothetical protein